MAWTDRYHDKWPRLTALYHIENEQNSEADRDSPVEGYNNTPVSPPGPAGFYRYYVHPDDIRSSRRSMSAYSMSQQSIAKSPTKKVPCCGICLGTMLIFSFAAIISVSVVLSILWTEPHVFSQTAENGTALSTITDLELLRSKEKNISKEVCTLMKSALERNNITSPEKQLHNCSISLTKKKGFMHMVLLLETGNNLIKGDIAVDNGIPKVKLEEQSVTVIETTTKQQISSSTIKQATTTIPITTTTKMKEPDSVLVLSSEEVKNLRDIFDGQDGSLNPQPMDFGHSIFDNTLLSGLSGNDFNFFSNDLNKITTQETTIEENKNNMYVMEIINSNNGTETQTNETENMTSSLDTITNDQAIPNINENEDNKSMISDPSIETTLASISVTDKLSSNKSEENIQNITEDSLIFGQYETHSTENETSKANSTELPMTTLSTTITTTESVSSTMYNYGHDISFPAQLFSSHAVHKQPYRDLTTRRDMIDDIFTTETTPLKHVDSANSPTTMKSYSNSKEPLAERLRMDMNLTISEPVQTVSENKTYVQELNVISNMTDINEFNETEVINTTFIRTIGSKDDPTKSTNQNVKSNTTANGNLITNLNNKGITDTTSEDGAAKHIQKVYGTKLKIVSAQVSITIVDTIANESIHMGNVSNKMLSPVDKNDTNTPINTDSNTITSSIASSNLTITKDAITKTIDGNITAVRNFGKTTPNITKMSSVDTNTTITTNVNDSKDSFHGIVETDINHKKQQKITELRNVNNTDQSDPAVIADEVTLIAATNKSASSQSYHMDTNTKTLDDNIDSMSNNTMNKHSEDQFNISTENGRIVADISNAALEKTDDMFGNTSTVSLKMTFPEIYTDSLDEHYVHNDTMKRNITYDKASNIIQSAPTIINEKGKTVSNKTTEPNATSENNVATNITNIYGKKLKIVNAKVIVAVVDTVSNDSLPMGNVSNTMFSPVDNDETDTPNNTDSNTITSSIASSNMTTRNDSITNTIGGNITAVRNFGKTTQNITKMSPVDTNTSTITNVNHNTDIYRGKIETDIYLKKQHKIVEIRNVNNTEKSDPTVKTDDVKLMVTKQKPEASNQSSHMDTNTTTLDDNVDFLLNNTTKEHSEDQFNISTENGPIVADISNATLEKTNDMFGSSPTVSLKMTFPEIYTDSLDEQNVSNDSRKRNITYDKTSNIIQSAPTIMTEEGTDSNKATEVNTTNVENDAKNITNVNGTKLKYVNDKVSITIDDIISNESLTSGVLSNNKQSPRNNGDTRMETNNINKTVSSDIPSNTTTTNDIVTDAFRTNTSTVRNNDKSTPNTTETSSVDTNRTTINVTTNDDFDFMSNNKLVNNSANLFNVSMDNDHTVADILNVTFDQNDDVFVNASTTSLKIKFKEWSNGSLDDNYVLNDIMKTNITFDQTSNTNQTYQTTFEGNQTNAYERLFRLDVVNVTTEITEQIINPSNSNMTLDTELLLPLLVTKVDRLNYSISTLVKLENKTESLINSTLLSYIEKLNKENSDNTSSNITLLEFSNRTLPLDDQIIDERDNNMTDVIVQDSHNDSRANFTHNSIDKTDNLTARSDQNVTNNLIDINGISPELAIPVDDATANDSIHTDAPRKDVLTANGYTDGNTTVMNNTTTGVSIPIEIRPENSTSKNVTNVILSNFKDENITLLRNVSKLDVHKQISISNDGAEEIINNTAIDNINYFKRNATEPLYKATNNSLPENVTMESMPAADNNLTNVENEYLTNINSKINRTESIEETNKTTDSSASSLDPNATNVNTLFLTGNLTDYIEESTNALAIVNEEHNNVSNIKVDNDTKSMVTVLSGNNTRHVINTESAERTIANNTVHEIQILRDAVKINDTTISSVSVSNVTQENNSVMFHRSVLTDNITDITESSAVNVTIQLQHITKKRNESERNFTIPSNDSVEDNSNLNSSLLATSAVNITVPDNVSIVSHLVNNTVVNLTSSVDLPVRADGIRLEDVIFDKISNISVPEMSKSSAPTIVDTTVLTDTTNTNETNLLYINALNATVQNKKRHNEDATKVDQVMGTTTTTDTATSFATIPLDNSDPTGLNIPNTTVIYKGNTPVLSNTETSTIQSITQVDVKQAGISSATPFIIDTQPSKVISIAPTTIQPSTKKSDVSTKPSQSSTTSPAISTARFTVKRSITNVTKKPPGPNSGLSSKSNVSEREGTTAPKRDTTTKATKLKTGGFNSGSNSFFLFDVNLLGQNAFPFSNLGGK
ncbi:serine-rich adhesin for platelets-like [Mytilus trossulus]|uniref:serine-rich adhesin for platelets-like n=1 Tax=Mytilus trossulus TaxID=6551 RepID=UPI00300593DD